MSKVRNWRGILPGKLALDQESWERHYKVWRMKQVGFSAAEIADRMGVGVSRAHQMLKRTRRMDFTASCPAELYMARQDIVSFEKLSHGSRA